MAFQLDGSRMPQARSFAIIFICDVAQIGFLSFRNPTPRTYLLDGAKRVFDLFLTQRNLTLPLNLHHDVSSDNLGIPSLVTFTQNHFSNGTRTLGK